ncbi:MAG TPA: winged helix-turn-helix domain-containing protein [Candidatus Paceibacterota bacterium]|nr:winged helix-turn-helix domain-containing protein [Candidatus Paceibacterota bacterium]
MEPLAKIFGSPARLKMLRLFVFNQNASLAPADIAKRSKLSPTVVRRELAELAAAGLVRKKGVRAAARYQVNPRFEHLAELDAFIRDTTSVRPQDILAALRRAGTPRLVVLSGLFVSIIESQIDLLVVGDTLDDRALATAVHSLEAELGREIRYASFATADFRYRLGVYDRLLRDVFDYPHRVLVDKIGL